MLDKIYISFIFAAFISGLIFIKKSSPFNYKLLLFFLLVTCMNESVCFYIKSNALGSTYIFYNFYYYFRFPLIGWMFLPLFYSKFQKKIVYLFFILSISFFFFNFFFYYQAIELHINYQLLGGIFTITFCLLHFYNILKRSHKENPLTTNFFWISTGFFFYFLGTLPFFGVLRLLVEKDIIFAEQYYILVKSLNIYLYSLIALDFYIQWKYQK